MQEVDRRAYRTNTTKRNVSIWLNDWRLGKPPSVQAARPAQPMCPQIAIVPEEEHL